MAGWTRLDSGIVRSTIWDLDSDTRVVWITMLALADRHGIVAASIPGLAHEARVPLAAAERALKLFSEPDDYSRSPENNGRRVEAVQGGWRLLNHDRYRLSARELATERQRRYRARSRGEATELEYRDRKRSSFGGGGGGGGGGGHSVDALSRYVDENVTPVSRGKQSGDEITGESGGRDAPSRCVTHDDASSRPVTPGDEARQLEQLRRTVPCLECGRPWMLLPGRDGRGPFYGHAGTAGGCRAVCSAAQYQQRKDAAEGRDTTDYNKVLDRICPEGDPNS